MKFVCDSCHAQYMISDDKVGAKGVKVRCKKCSNVIVVKKVVEPDPTTVMQNPLASSQTQAGDAPFGGLDLDEIGQAFDSVLSNGGQNQPDPFVTAGGEERTQAGAPLAAAGDADEGDGDHESTRVMDLKSMQGLAAQSADERTGLGEIPDAVKAQGFVSNAANGERNGHAAASAHAASGEIPQSDWYVAVDEEQQGPMSLDTVKGHWEAGRVTSDSLVWRNGYSDWLPLSTIPELVKVLTPLPTPRKAPEPPADKHAPAGATANGPQVPFVSPAPAAVPDPDEIDWKPAAASALASLVAEEMEALSKPAPKPRAEPVGVGETTGMKPLLPILEPAPTADTSYPSLPAAPAEPLPAPVARRPEPSPVASRPVPAPYPSSPELQAYPAPAAYVPPPPVNNNTKYMFGLAALVVLCIAAVGVAWLFKGGKPAPEPQQQLALNTPPPRATAPVPAAVPTPAPAPPKEAAPAPTPTAAAPTPAATAVPAPTPPPAAAQSSRPEPAAHESRAERIRKWKEQHRGGGHAAAPAPEADRPPPEPPATKPTHSSDSDLLGAAGQSKIDKDFDSLLGGGGGTPAPKAAKSSGSDVYIPPAVSNLPAQLTQGDIMGVVAGHKGQIVGCIHKQRAADPDSSGTVKMHWVIQKSGGVSGVKVESSEFKSSPMGRCMSSTIHGWRFPKFTGAAMPIDFPFKF